MNSPSDKSDASSSPASAKLPDDDVYFFNPWDYAFDADFTEDVGSGSDAIPNSGTE